jgi:hypothetical protein
MTNQDGGYQTGLGSTTLDSSIESIDSDRPLHSLGNHLRSVLFANQNCGTCSQLFGQLQSLFIYVCRTNEIGS